MHSIYQKCQQKHLESYITFIMISLTLHSTDDNNNKCFLSSKSHYLERLLMDHSTLKTGVMAAENSSLPSH